MTEQPKDYAEEEFTDTWEIENPGVCFRNSLLMSLACWAAIALFVWWLA